MKQKMERIDLNGASQSIEIEDSKHIDHFNALSSVLWLELVASADSALQHKRWEKKSSGNLVVEPVKY